MCHFWPRCWMCSGKAGLDCHCLWCWPSTDKPCKSSDMRVNCFVLLIHSNPTHHLELHLFTVTSNLKRMCFKTGDTQYIHYIYRKSMTHSTLIWFKNSLSSAGNGQLKLQHKGGMLCIFSVGNLSAPVISNRRSLPIFLYFWHVQDDIETDLDW